jgi:uncharacterized membrane protein YphA (DoxX/SURF4 family)
MSPKSKNILDWTSLLCRWIIGCLFLYMGLSKALDPVGFLKLVRQYDLPVHYLLLNGIAAVLPWFEAFCGLLLLLGVAVRGTSLLMLGMLVPFTFLVIQRAMEIASLKQIAFCAVKFDCGCGVGDVYICAKVLENCLLAAVSAWLLMGGGKKFALRYDLRPAP